MAKMKIYECEEREMKNGGVMKKLVVQVEGKQYTDKGVTVWSDHPLFATLAAGMEIEGEIEVKDSQTPNPKGGFYKNRTLLKPGQVPAAPHQPFTNTDRIFNVIQLDVIPKLQRILAWQDRRDVLDGIEKPKKEIEMPDFGENDDPMASSPF